MTEQVRNGLVILQPTSFCNINCNYCYLNDRDKNNRMQLSTVEQIAQRIFESPYFPEEANLLWHAGEPLTVPVSFYEGAISIFNRLNFRKIKLNWCIQTNGTLITPAWCEFFKKQEIDIGVSIDGPQQYHDANRVDRRGKGTFMRVLRGIKLLQDYDISFGVLATISRKNIKSAEAFWDFLVENKIVGVGFNEEEATGTNQSTTLGYNEVLEDYRAFLEALIRKKGDLSRDLIGIREIDNMLDRILQADLPVISDLVTPLATLSFDYLGNISTFSPELLGLVDPRYGNFKFGNVYRNSIEDVLRSPKFHRVNANIQAGVRRCQKSCDYFDICGGGNPSAKLGEHGSFDVAETLNCQLGVKTVFETVARALEHRLEANIGV